MVMQNFELDPPDQRKTSGMEDSTAMTIEFLRARLLSERSISRSARQRADELAKKVIELEEQLRMVTHQRKMAEKATADVLAILESQGISDVSEEFESGSDLENVCESGVSNDSARDGETYMSSKGRQNGSDELSSSDLDSSPLFGRSLSWKGRHNSPHSLEKYKTSNFTRQNSFSSIRSSPKHHLGKSCRKIRHRQTRSIVEESRDKPIMDNCQENEVVSSVGFPNCSDGYGKEKDMEKALEHQAQLIDQYEAMEKAQRDWEDKFTEDNGAAPDSCDRRNHSDMAEEKDGSKTQSSDKVTYSNAQEYKAEPADVCFSEEIFKAGDSDNMPKSFNGSAGGYRSQKSAVDNRHLIDLFDEENSLSLLKENQNDCSVNYQHRLSDNNHHQDSHSHGYPNSKQTDCSPTNVNHGLLQNEASRNISDLYAIVSHQQESYKCSGVLESLQEARIFLQHQLNNKLSLVETGYTNKSIKPSALVGKSEDRFDIPIACPGLFRLPTDFSDEATARFNVHGSTSGFTSNFYLDRGISKTSGAQLSINPYPGKMLSLSADDHQSLATTQYLQNGSRFDSEKHPFDPFNDDGLPSSDKYNYPTFPIYPSYQNATPKMPFGELSRPYSSSTVGVPRAYDFSFQDDHLRSNMYI